MFSAENIYHRRLTTLSMLTAKWRRLLHAKLPNIRTDIASQRLK